MTLIDARRDVDLRLEAYKRSNTYANAVALQRAQRRFDAIVSESRKELFVIDGDAGQHTIPEEEVSTEALRRIMEEIEDAEGEKYNSILLYIHKVAKQALKATGRLNG